MLTFPRDIVTRWTRRTWDAESIANTDDGNNRLSRKLARRKANRNFPAVRFMCDFMCRPDM